jgi:hypothetical protein
VQDTPFLTAARLERRAGALTETEGNIGLTKAQEQTNITLRFQLEVSDFNLRGKS